MLRRLGWLKMLIGFGVPHSTLLIECPIRGDYSTEKSKSFLCKFGSIPVSSGGIGPGRIATANFSIFKNTGRERMCPWHTVTEARRNQEASLAGSNCPRRTVHEGLDGQLDEKKRFGDEIVSPLMVELARS